MTVGYICSPTPFERTEPRFTVRVHDRPGRGAGSVEIIDGFPTAVTGRALLLPIDNLNTDGIYSGKLTYRDDVTPEEMAAASMANYDPSFDRLAEPGDLIAAGRNFGTGSSREQAATCLKLRGIPCVVAASFSETYKRNAFNNGFIVFECPALVDHLRETLAGHDEATIVGPSMTIDYERSVILIGGRKFAFAPLSAVAQELVVAGGAESLVRETIIAEG